jgi:hypothetical protein
MAMNFIEKTRLYKIIFLAIPIAIWLVNYQSTDNDFSFCIFKNLFGIKCYGCGLTRGLSAMLHLDFKRMYALNKINLITIPLLSFLYVKKVLVLFDKKKIAKIIP